MKNLKTLDEKNDKTYKSISEIIDIIRVKHLAETNTSIRNFIHRNGNLSVPILEAYRDYAASSKYKVSLIGKVSDNKLKNALIKDFDADCITNYGMASGKYISEIETLQKAVKDLTGILSLFGFTKIDWEGNTKEFFKFVLDNVKKPMDYKKFSNLSSSYKRFVSENGKEPKDINELRDYIKKK